jgi:hypothetical protein
MSGADIVARAEKVAGSTRSNIVVEKLLDSLAHRLDMNYAFAAHVGYNRRL